MSSVAKTKPKIRVVLDTNVLISALNFGGLPGEVVKQATKERVQLFLSSHILEELERVLVLKFSWSKSRARQARVFFESVATVVRPTNRVTIISDEPDNRVLECAEAGRAQVIVSGDKHLLDLRCFGSTQIMTPKRFFSRYNLQHDSKG